MCNCIERVNEILKPQNRALKVHELHNTTTGEFTRHVLEVRTEATGRQHSEIVPLVAEFCPFCGERHS